MIINDPNIGKLQCPIPQNLSKCHPNQITSNYCTILRYLNLYSGPKSGKISHFASENSPQNSGIAGRSLHWEFLVANLSEIHRCHQAGWDINPRETLGIFQPCEYTTGYSQVLHPTNQIHQMGLSENVGYIPNEIAINRDIDH